MVVAEGTAMATTTPIPSFRRCPGCGYDLVTHEGERGCHYYACPYLPEELDTTCPVCVYDFTRQDGNAECGDPPSCEFALKEAPIRVANVRAWAAGQPRDDQPTEQGRSTLPGGPSVDVTTDDLRGKRVEHTPERQGWRDPHRVPRPG